MNRNITDIELSMVCEVLTSQMGLSFPIERLATVRRNLVSIATVFGFQNMNEFIQWLLSTPLENDQTEIFASWLTISETYFWREPQAFSAFSQNVLAELVAARREHEKSIHIWCVGCSSGEEAYSIAIALHRTIPDIKDWKITILATDISSQALAKARKGIYRAWSFRNAPSWLKSSYFKTPDNLEFEIIPEIREMVTFSGFNLTHENYLSSVCKNHKMDIIFCRNVLMYFTIEWVAKIVQRLFQALTETGWLVVASCELSSELFPHFIPVNFPGAVLYRKGTAEFSGNNIPATIGYPQPYANIIPSPVPEMEVIKDSVAIVSKVVDLNPDGNLNSVRLLAGQGHLEEALSVCNEAIAADKLAAGLYFLRASILQELDKIHEAIQSLKQAIYICPDYLMGHFTLGNLFARLGNIKNATRYFNNTLELLNACSDDDIPAQSEGLSAKYIRGIILNNLQTQKAI